MFLNNFAWRNYIFPFCLVAKCCVISTFLLLELRQAADGGGVNDFYHYLIPIKRCREGGDISCHAWSKKINTGCLG